MDDKKPNECCNREANLGPVEHQGKDISFRKCKVCGCRHIEFTADPGKLGVKGATL